MSSDAVTFGKALAIAAGTGSEWWKTAVVTSRAVQRRQFRMTDELVLEVELEAGEPEWLIPLMERMSKLMNLSANWDSYGASPINPKAVLGAVNFLLANVSDIPTLPDIIPHRSGGLQIEWHNEEADLEVLVLAENQYRISYAKSGADEPEDVIAHNPHLAVQALKEMTA